jgi:exonuclease III
MIWYEMTENYWSVKIPHELINNGIGIILNDHIAKHVVKIEGYLNRILTLSLCFRKNINIKIIIIYLPANGKDHKITEQCNTIIKNQINSTLSQNHQIILLGDFNIDVKSIKTMLDKKYQMDDHMTFDHLIYFATKWSTYCSIFIIFRIYSIYII